MNTANFWAEIKEARDQRHGESKWHCDDLRDNPDTPAVVRAFLAVTRVPAHGGGRQTPPLYATHLGERVRVTMASRFGDVGITTDLTGTNYKRRVLLPELTDFGDAP